MLPPQRAAAPAIIGYNQRHRPPAERLAARASHIAWAAAEDSAGLRVLRGKIGGNWFFYQTYSALKLQVFLYVQFVTGLIEMASSGKIDVLLYGLGA